MDEHAVVFALNANSIKLGTRFVGLSYSFTGMLHNEDITWNIVQIPKFRCNDHLSLFNFERWGGGGGGNHTPPTLPLDTDH